MDVGIKKALTILFLSLFCTQTAQGNSVCNFSQGGEPTWESAAFILAETIVGFIPDVGTWASAFLQLMELTQTSSFSIDITECVKTLIEQELDGRVLNSTQTFIGYWNTTIAVWNDSALVSNASHTKSEMADLIWSEAFNGALVHLPEIAKKEQVMVQWLDIASSEVFIFESTAVQYTAYFGNGSSESCHQWKTAQLYTSSIVDHIEKQMIYCPGSCLNTSTFQSHAHICNYCDCPEPFCEPRCYYKISDLYNGTCDSAYIAYCDAGTTHVNSCPCPYLPSGTSGVECQKKVDDYNARVIDKMKSYLDHIMDWLHNRQEIMKEQLDTWCQKNKTSLITP